MKKRNTVLSALALIAMLFAILSCTDDFSEKDFLNLQYKLARAQDSLKFVQKMEEMRLLAKQDSSFYVLQSEINLKMQMQMDSAQVNYQKKLLQDMGLLMSLTIQVTEDKKPVQGITVDISNLGSGAKKASAITDAHGMVKFQDVVVGGNHIALSGTNYLSASVSVFFSDNNTTTSTGYVIPVRRNENMALPLFADGSSVSGQTATVKGKVTVESDLTNKAPEVIPDLAIAANLSDFLQDIVWPNNGWVNAYNFSDPGAFGTAVSDANGDYTMTVPASTTNDYDVELIIPSFEMDQTLAIAERNGDKLSDREITTVKTAFGPEHSGSYTSIPFVRGTKATFDDPPSGGGSGLAFSFNPIPTSLGSGSFVWQDSDPTTVLNYNAFSCNDSTWVYYRHQLSDRGSGYTTSPLITVSDGTASNARMYASLQGRFTSVTSTGGAGYTAGSTVNGAIWYKALHVNDDTDTSKQTVLNFSFTVPADGILPTALLDSIINSGGGTGITSDFRSINYNNNYSWRIFEWGIDFTGGGSPTTDAAGSATLDGTVEYIRLQDGGQGYTSTPTITYSGGGASSQATARIDRFETYYYIEISSGGTGYSSIPAITLHFKSGSWYNWGTQNPNSYSSVRGGELVNSYCDFDNNQGSITNNLKINNGVIEWYNPVFTYMTYIPSQTAPTTIIPEITSRVWEADVSIYQSGNQEGEFSSLTNFQSGSGYTSPFNVVIEPSITALPGSGGVLELTGGYYSGTEYIWQQGYSVISRGSGYQHNANQQSVVNYNVNQWIYNIVPGSTYVRNIKYGTGQILDDVDGD